MSSESKVRILTAEYPKGNSSFYSRLYEQCDIGDFESLPFTTPEDLRNFGEETIGRGRGSTEAS